ncbi:MAG: D-glycerate dehydrogenase [Anaerolineales bacterium]|nr:D-glycerate dehydrogenase [Anaerolineales bacterium]
MKPKVYVTRRLPESARNELEQSCEVQIWNHETPPPYEVIAENIVDKEGLLCLLTDRIDAALIRLAPRLKVISQCAVGYDNIDIRAAAQRNILVGNTPGVLTEATADFAFTLLMAGARRLGEAIDFVRAGKWETWGLTLLLGQEVYGATLGIIGMGRIGQSVARRARGFNMRVLYYDTQPQPQAEAELGATYLELDDLLCQADFITLHVSLSPQTQGLIGERAFSLMKSSAVLVNTARGPIVDSEALYQALKSGKIACAALDVTDPEPLPTGHKLLSLPNLIVAPHIASATTTTRTRMALMAVRNLVAGLRGEALPFQVTLPGK